MTKPQQDALAQRTTGTLGQTQTAVAQLNRFRTGVVYNYIGVSDPTIDGFYSNGLAATNPDDLTKILESANEYIARQHLTISLLTVNSFSLCQPWVKGFNAQAQSTGSTPVNLSFYEARYWWTRVSKKHRDISASSQTKLPEELRGLALTLPAYWIPKMVYQQN